jgi:hypothetical protein
MATILILRVDAMVQQGQHLCYSQASTNHYRDFCQPQWQNKKKIKVRDYMTSNIPQYKVILKCLVLGYHIEFYILPLQMGRSLRQEDYRDDKVNKASNNEAHH